MFLEGGVAEALDVLAEPQLESERDPSWLSGSPSKLAVNGSPSPRRLIGVNPVFAAPRCPSAASTSVAWLRMAPPLSVRLSIGTSSDVCEPSAAVSV